MLLGVATILGCYIDIRHPIYSNEVPPLGERISLCVFPMLFAVSALLPYRKIRKPITRKLFGFCLAVVSVKFSWIWICGIYNSLRYWRDGLGAVVFIVLVTIVALNFVAFVGARGSEQGEGEAT